MLRYTDEFLISELKRFYKENNRVPIIKDLENNKNFPDSKTYQRHFGSWNNALLAAGLKINKVGKLTGDECCDICGSTYTNSRWVYKNNKRICSKCRKSNRYYLHGTLDPTSNCGIGVITEHIVYEVLGDCEKCNTRDDFNSEYDLISNRYGNINVKSATLFNTKYECSWNFGIPINSKIPDCYICIGFTKDRLKVLKVWIVPKNSKLINKYGIWINSSEIGLKRAYKYEVDPTPYNEVYQNLDITTLPEFRNFNPNISIRNDTFKITVSEV